MDTAISPPPFDISPTKRRKLPSNRHRHRRSHPLLPGLPDHVAQSCLARLPPSLLFSVCHSWRRLIYSSSFPPFLSLYALLSNHFSNSVEFSSFDPISSKWELLPPPPSDPPLDLMVRHPSFISRNLAIQSVSVAGNLVLLAASAHNFAPALPRPLVFCPASASWHFGPPLPAPRRWCAAGALCGSVYVASGISTYFSPDVARSAEKWDVQKRKAWEKVSGLRDGRFSREAIDAVGWRGKLCMVNVKGDAPKEGLVYDLERDVWEEMPEGMIGGWRGPVAAMDEEVMYVVEEARGSLRRYNPEMDVWEEVITSNRLKGAVQMAAGGGRACVVSRSREEIGIVDVVAAPPRLWFERAPMGTEVVAAHVLPRMSGRNFDVGTESTITI